MLAGTPCRRGGREIRDLHGVDAAVRLRHLPRCDVPVVLEMRPTRYRGPSCAGSPTTTQRCAWYEPRRPTTTVDAPWAGRMVINSTVADAARQLGGSEEPLDGLLDRWIERTVDWDAGERLGVLGLDEIARRRGHRAVVALVTVPLAAGGVEMVAGRADRTKQTVAAFLRALSETLRRTIERACTDRYAGVVNASQAERPWAEIVIARFHVARASRDCADTVRKQDLTRLKRALPKAEYAEITGAMGPFRKQPGALQPEERNLRERVCRDSPKSEAADHRRADLTDLCERDDTKAAAKRAIRGWGKRVRERGLAACERVLGTLERWMEEITHDVQGRQTSGFVEGFNNRVKGLKRRCDGLSNVARLFQRLTVDWHGYQCFGHP